MNNPDSLDIIIPCYNPRENWSDKIIQAHERLSVLIGDHIKINLIMVNDGSKQIPEQALNIIKTTIPHFQYVSYDVNKGKGFALRKGIAQSKSNFCIYTDVDFPYTEDSFMKIHRALRDNETDIAIGIRNQSYYNNIAPARKRISKFLQWLIRTFLRIPTADTQCGLKGFNKKGKAVFLDTTVNRYLFDLEFIYLASKDKDIKIKPVEVELKPGIELSKMNYKILLNEGMNFLKILLRN